MEIFKPLLELKNMKFRQVTKFYFNFLNKAYNSISSIGNSD